MADAMACFQSRQDSEASAFKQIELAYVHCLSKENLCVLIQGFQCASLVCREVHVSYVESMDERRRALVPAAVENDPIDEIFSGVRSPILIRINSSCDIKCLDEINLDEEGLVRTLIWSFEVIPAPAVQNVKPRIIQASKLDKCFPPVNLDEDCNCSSLTAHCLVSMLPDESSNLEDLSDEDVFSEEDEEEPQEDGEDSDSQTEEVEYFSESFAVKGSFWAKKYQDALKKSMEMKTSNTTVRATFETSNLMDKNAITFEIFDGTVWLVIGYCGVEKIPKLTRAMAKGEIVSLKFCYIKRKWVPPVNDFRLYSAVTLTKKGRWDKNDSNNKYNSDLSHLFN